MQTTLDEKSIIDKLMELRDIYKKKKVFTDEEAPVTNYPYIYLTCRFFTPALIVPEDCFERFARVKRPSTQYQKRHMRFI